MAEVFHLQVERDDSDYHAFRRQVTCEARMRSYYRAFSWSCGVAAGVIAIAATGAATQWGRQPLGAAQFVLLFLSFFGAWSLLPWLVAPLVVDRLNPPPRIFRAPLNVALNDDGVQLAGRFFSQSFRWAAISDVVETTTHVFLRIDGVSSVVIPKRAFAPASSVAGFVREIDDRLAAARAGQT